MKFMTPLNIPANKIGKFEIVRTIEPPGKTFTTANPRHVIYGGQKSKTIKFHTETLWHRLLENGGVWMSDIPSEHAQMLACVKGMRGKVLVGGLGLGLAATILAKRKSVTKVVVVELSKAVIDLVAPYLGSNKIEVVHADLFKYLTKLKTEFDYAFYDIWKSDGEGTFMEVVCPLYTLSQGVIRREPINWNEDVMRGQLAQSIYHRLSFQTPEARKMFAKELAHFLPPWEEGDNIWHNWMVPFFQWWKETNPETELLRKAVNFYASFYGRWNWEEIWEYLLEHELRC